METNSFKLNNIFEENAKVYQTKPVRATKYQPGMETGWMVYMINKLTKDVKKQSHVSLSQGYFWDSLSDCLR